MYKGPPLMQFCVFVLQDDIVAYESEQYAVLASLYMPMYLKLVDVLLQKVQYPPDSEYESFNSGK